MKNYLSKIINMLRPGTDGLSAEENFNLGSAAFKKEDYRTAIKYYTRSIKTDHTFTELYRSRAVSYIRLKNFDKALKDYTTAISLTSVRKELYLERGVVHQNLRKYTDAITDFNSAISIDSEYDKAYLSRGLNYMLLEDYESALADMKKAEEYNKENGVILKPYTDECRRQIEKNPKSILKDFLNNPLVKQQQAIYDYQCKRIDKMKFTDKDEIPWGIGEFGYDRTNPIPTNTSLGSITYLARLRTMTGEKVSYNRLGSTLVSNIENPVDIYEISDSNGFICELYISMYHKRNSEKAPRNFKRA
jgi:tetratricopeptide (TPR) repeat protein